MKKGRLLVDTYRCKWCEACVVEMPEFFFYDARTGKATATSEAVELTEALEAVIALCPTKCIEVVEE